MFFRMSMFPLIHYFCHNLLSCCILSHIDTTIYKIL